MADRDLLAVMRSWVDQRGHEALFQPWLVYRETVQDSWSKRAALIEFEDPSTMGQVTVWDTGECEVDLGSTTDPARTLIRSIQVSSGEQLIQTLEEAVTFCQANSP